MTNELAERISRFIDALTISQNANTEAIRLITDRISNLADRVKALETEAYKVVDIGTRKPVDPRQLTLF